MTIPAAMKVSVAAIDRRDNLLTPQTPCPLVQPFDITVPNPTHKPASTRTGSDRSVVI